MPIDPQRGEIWLVDFSPQTGAEILKQRPALVLDRGHPSLPLRIVVPVTGWQPAYSRNPAKINLQPSTANGLTKESAADAYQVKAADLSRFATRLGKLTPRQVDDVAAAVATIIDAP